MRASLSPPAWRRSARCSSCSTRGAHVVAMDDLYGGSYRILERVRKRSANIKATLCRSVLSRESRESDPAANPHGLGRDADQPAAQDRRPRGDRGDRAQAQADLGVRQHLRLALDPASARARLRHRGALDDQVSERPLGRDRRRRDPARRRILQGADWLSCRTRSAACRARSTPSSRCAASRRSRCAWSAIAATRCTSPRGSRSIRRSSA